MAAHAEENYELLKAKVSQVDLREILQPDFAQLLEETIKPTEMALILFKMDVISMKKLQECMSESTRFFQNFEVYRAVQKKNAGEALIKALYETRNFHVLKLLQSNCGPSGFTEVPKFNSKQVLILGSISPTKVPNSAKPPIDHEYYTLSCMDTFGVENLSRLQEDSMDGVLVRVVIHSEVRDSQKHFNSANIHLVEEVAITKFLESQLDLDLDTQTVGRPPQELYVNTRFFTAQGWEGLSKLLYYFCRNTLEHLWLDEVNYTVYCEGTKWMKTLNDDAQQSIPRFAKLKTFIFQNGNYCLEAATFQEFLGILKPLNCPLEKFWNVSKCKIQIWNKAHSPDAKIEFKKVLALIDPADGIFFVLEGNIHLQKEVYNFFVPWTIKLCEGSVPVSKLFYDSLTTNILAYSIKFKNLTSLCFRSAHLMKADTYGIRDQILPVLDVVISNLHHLKLLQKLFLHSTSTQRWRVNLESLVKNLSCLEKLSFLYLGMTEFSCSSLKASHYPWKESVQTIVFENCKFSPEVPGWHWSCNQIKNSRVVLQRSCSQSADEPSPFNVSVTPGRDYISYDSEMLREFFN